MPPKRKITLSDEVKEALGERLRESQRASERTRENFLIDVYLTAKAGLTERELMEKLGVGAGTANDYKRRGEELFRRREKERNRRAGDDPDGRAELGAVG